MFNRRQQGDALSQITHGWGYSAHTVIRSESDWPSLVTGESRDVVMGIAAVWRGTCTPLLTLSLFLLRIFLHGGDKRIARYIGLNAIL